MKEDRIKEAPEEIERKVEERDLASFVEDRMEEKERRERKMEEKQAIHINLISSVEMKAHTKEMRNEIDRKFVRCLMVQGLTKLEAIKRAKMWSNEWDSEKHGN